MALVVVVCLGDQEVRIVGGRDEALCAWVETRARLRHSTRRVYKSHIRLHLRRVFDGVLLRELGVSHVEQAFSRLFADGLSAATVRRLFSTLRTALNAAVREGLNQGRRERRRPTGAL